MKALERSGERGNEVASELKSEQGPFAMVQTSLAGRELSQKSFQRRPKNLGGVERTGEYYARLAEALAKWVPR